MPPWEGPGPHRRQQLPARSAPDGRDSSRVAAAACGLAWTSSVYWLTQGPSSPQGLRRDLVGNRLFAGEVKLRLAHPGRCRERALTSKTRGKGEEERTDGQTGAREDSRDEPGPRAPQAGQGESPLLKPALEVRPCPPRCSGASSSVKEQGLQTQPPGPSCQQPQDASAETRLYPTTPQAWVPLAEDTGPCSSHAQRSDHPWPWPLICAWRPHVD